MAQLSITVQAKRGRGREGNSELKGLADTVWTRVCALCARTLSAPHFCLSSSRQQSLHQLWETSRVVHKSAITRTTSATVSESFLQDSVVSEVF